MDFDFGRMIGSIQTSINDFIEKATVYFQSLTLYEMIGWGGEGLGLILVILAIILW